MLVIFYFTVYFNNFMLSQKLEPFCFEIKANILSDTLTEESQDEFLV